VASPLVLKKWISNRDVSKLTPLEVPSTNLETWAEAFVDTLTGEKLLKGNKICTFSQLVLTNRS
jgi:hypothetical protein